MLKKRNFFLLGTILLITAIAWGYYLYNKPRQSAAGEKAAQVVSAALFYKEYQMDEVAADKKYLGKTIEVTGAIASVSGSSNAKMYILSSGNAAGGISCQMFADGKNAGADPKTGETITIKGKCTGFLMDVNLVDCIIK